MSSNIDYKTIVIAALLSVTLSAGISYWKPPIVGPQGAPGPQGDPGPPGPGFGELIHDSGWITMDGNNSLEICILDDPNVFVYMIGKYPSVKAHQLFYGLEINGDRESGAFWWIDKDNQLFVYRGSDSIHYVQVRVLVWQLPS